MPTKKPTRKRGPQESVTTSARKRAKAPPLRSGFERKVAAYLGKSKIKYEYEPELIPFVQPASKRNYIPDFKLSNGVYVEAKGKFTPADRKKMLWVIEQNPDKDIRILFMRDNYLRKGSKTKYSAWCAKNGIECAVSSLGHIPEEWMKG